MKQSGLFPGIIGYHKKIKELTESEGFSSRKLMFKKLEEYAGGLETPKKFYLYTLEWLK